MRYPAPASDGPISRAHNRALSQEIGDQLRCGFDREPADMPLHLQLLMQRFRDHSVGN